MKELFEQAGWRQRRASTQSSRPSYKQKVTEQVVSSPDSVAPPEAVCKQPASRRVNANRTQRQVSRQRPDLTQLHLDEQLPIVQQQEAIIQHIQQHPVLILAGETGSGKTTQLPKLALLAGRGQLGRIALTQPRRLAARSVANRIAEELDSKLGTYVGVKVRFHQQIESSSVIKVLTDGMLLAEIAGDALLSEYDTIIVDEAHERSLNIDFLLGYLRQLIDRRPELKIIVTSATIDLQRFSAFFNQAPIISVSGRTYPVETRYRPLADLALADDDEVDLNVAIVHAVVELTRLDPMGDILIFLPGEADIREASEALRLEGLAHTEILPLYARQSYADQQRIFTTGGTRRIVLSTNVAETSLTVPGIRHVIDTGLARIKRYSVRNKVQRLPIEAISQAAANQRKGRCGRVAPGVCIRLYSEADFMARPAFTEPEIQRSNLASVLLQMQALGLGNIANFPLIDPPAGKQINDGYRLLEALQAVDAQGQLTAVGRMLSQLPVDPRLARMLLAANQYDVLSEVCVLAAVLSLQDPRETPADKQQAAREKHRLFEDTRSDFVTLLQLWQRYNDQRKHSTKNKLKQWCQQHYVSYRRMREWQEMISQLHQSVANLSWKMNEMMVIDDQLTQTTPSTEYTTWSIRLHQALLTGLLGQIAVRDDAQQCYIGARHVHLVIHPSSTLAKRKPKWIMAFEWLETSKTWARLVAEIEVTWLLSLASHLLKRHVSEPYWSKKQGRVLAKERLTLYGLLIAADQRTDYGKVDPEAAHDIFIREGLVQGHVQTQWSFLTHNLALIQQALSWEDKTRYRDVLVDESVLMAFYQQRLPANLCRTRDLQRWLVRDQQRMNTLYMSQTDVFRKDIEQAQDYPDQLQLTNQLTLPVHYHFEPGKVQDGLSIDVRLSQLALLSEQQLAYLVPGLLVQKITWIIRQLPKALRVRLQPAAEQAQQAAQALSSDQIMSDTFDVALARVLSRQAHCDVSPTDWQSAELPLYLQPRIVLFSDDNQQVLAVSRSLHELRTQFLAQAQAALNQRALAQTQLSDWVMDEVTQWQWEQIPKQQTMADGGVLYMALVVADHGVRLTAVANEIEADQQQAAGVRYLLKCQLASTLAGIRKQWIKTSSLCLPWARWHRSCAELVEQLITRALTTLSPEAAHVRTEVAFMQLVTQVRGKITGLVNDYAHDVQQLLTHAQHIMSDADRLQTPTRQASIAQVRSFIESLLTPSFVTTCPEYHWQQLPRYLKAAAYRLEKISENLPLDERRIQEYQQVEILVEQARNQGMMQHDPSTFARVEQMAIELWVSIFAQPLARKGQASFKQLQALVNR